LQKRESGQQTRAEVAHSGVWDVWISTLCQPKAFPWGNNEVGIILLGEGLQTVPSGVGDHEHRPSYYKNRTRHGYDL
jgi:hypothetical protein